jgi:hypothetical protein
MTDSILNSTKKTLGLAEDYTAFDIDVLMHINSIFSVLNQLGVGPAVGFSIEDDTAVWSDFLEDDLRLNDVKTYMYLRVRMLFDPPTTSFHLSAMKEQIEEFGWRINVYREEEGWTDPNPVPIPEEIL